MLSASYSTYVEWWNGHKCGNGGVDNGGAHMQTRHYEASKYGEYHMRVELSNDAGRVPIQLRKTKTSYLDKNTFIEIVEEVLKTSGLWC